MGASTGEGVMEREREREREREGIRRTRLMLSSSVRSSPSPSSMFIPFFSSFFFIAIPPVTVGRPLHTKKSRERKRL